MYEIRNETFGEKPGKHDDITTKWWNRHVMGCGTNQQSSILFYSLLFVFFLVSLSVPSFNDVQLQCIDWVIQFLLPASGGITQQWDLLDYTGRVYEYDVAFGFVLNSFLTFSFIIIFMTVQFSLLFFFIVDFCGTCIYWEFLFFLFNFRAEGLFLVFSLSWSFVEYTRKKWAWTSHNIRLIWYTVCSKHKNWHRAIVAVCLYSVHGLSEANKFVRIVIYAWCQIRSAQLISKLHPTRKQSWNVEKASQKSNARITIHIQTWDFLGIQQGTK